MTPSRALRNRPPNFLRGLLYPKPGAGSSFYKPSSNKPQTLLKQVLDRFSGHKP